MIALEKMFQLTFLSSTPKCTHMHGLVGGSFSLNVANRCCQITQQASSANSVEMSSVRNVDIVSPKTCNEIIS